MKLNISENETFLREKKLFYTQNFRSNGTSYYRVACKCRKNDFWQFLGLSKGKYLCHPKILSKYALFSEIQF